MIWCLKAHVLLSGLLESTFPPFFSEVRIIRALFLFLVRHPVPVQGSGFSGASLRWLGVIIIGNIKGGGSYSQTHQLIYVAGIFISSVPLSGGEARDDHGTFLIEDDKPSVALEVVHILPHISMKMAQEYG